jgi:hypothetical protein
VFGVDFANEVQFGRDIASENQVVILWVIINAFVNYFHERKSR